MSQARRVIDWLAAELAGRPPTAAPARAPRPATSVRLEQFLGTSSGLSPATINWPTADGQAEAAGFNKRSLAETDYVSVWVDGIHLKVRLESVWGGFWLTRRLSRRCRARLVPSFSAYLVSQMQYAGCLQRSDQVELDVFGREALEQTPALAEQHGHELDLQNVEHPGLQALLGGEGTVQHTSRSPAAALACSTQATMPWVTKCTRS